MSSVSQVGTPGTIQTNSGSNSGSITGVWNASQALNAGDLLVACVTAWGTTSAGAISTPSGWTQQVTKASSTGRLQTAIYTKVAAGADAAPNFTATMTGTATNATMSCELYELTNQDGTTPVVTTGTGDATTNGVTITSTGNVNRGGSFAIDCVGVGDVSSGTMTFTPDGFWTETADTGLTTGREHAEYCTYPNPPTGSTLSDSPAGSVSANEMTGCLIVVQPPASGGGPDLAAVATPSSVGSTISATITGPTAAGDTLLAVVACTGSGKTVSGVTDTQSNTYVQVSVAPNSHHTLYLFRAVNGPGGTGPTVALGKTDSVTATFSAAPSAAMHLAVIDLAGYAVTDQQNDGSTSGSQATLTMSTATLAAATDFAICAFASTTSAGALTLSAGWKQLLSETSGVYLTVGWQFLASTSCSVTGTVGLVTGIEGLVAALKLSPVNLTAKAVSINQAVMRAAVW